MWINDDVILLIILLQLLLIILVFTPFYEAHSLIFQNDHLFMMYILDVYIDKVKMSTLIKLTCLH